MHVREPRAMQQHPVVRKSERGGWKGHTGVTGPDAKDGSRRLRSVLRNAPRQLPSLKLRRGSGAPQRGVPPNRHAECCANFATSAAFGTAPTT